MSRAIGRLAAKIGPKYEWGQRAMLNILVNTVVVLVLFGTIAQSLTADAAQQEEPTVEGGVLRARSVEPGIWFRLISDHDRKAIAPPTKLAIIACRVDRRSKEGTTAGAERKLDWHLPVECMRVIETVKDAAALSNLWLRQMTPNLADYGTCAEVSMAYAPTWEATHRNWVIVKVGCPTKIIDADGNVVGWHMPECQGTLPGTDYPLRCRFDPTEI